MLPIPQLLDASSARRALAGFFLSGLLFSFLGAILPAWGYHWEYRFTEVGSCFLALNLGIVASLKPAVWLLGRYGVRIAVVVACGLACMALLYLAWVGRDYSAYWRMAGLAVVGCAAGVLNTGMFHAISPLYEHDPAATLNLAGALFGFGCLATALLLAGTFYAYSLFVILVLLSTVPAAFALLYYRTKLEAGPAVEQPSMRQAFRDFRSPAAVLFTLLLFFQFGNEWAIAGWLPLYLLKTLEISPPASLWMLSLYWLALLVGRMAAQTLLGRVRHRRLLWLSVLAALVGCVMLLITRDWKGAALGILLVGSGFATVYPLVVEMIGIRFPYYHPGFFNGIFSFALTGGLLAPWTLGYFTASWGIRAVMGLPLLGTIMVLVLLALLWLESKLSGLKATAG